jgi:hypothetical protein
MDLSNQRGKPSQKPPFLPQEVAWKAKIGPRLKRGLPERCFDLFVKKNHRSSLIQKNET